MKKYNLSQYRDIEEKNIFENLKDEVDYLIEESGFLGTKLPAEIEYFNSEEEMFNELKKNPCTVRYDAGWKLYYIDVTLASVDEIDDEGEIGYSDLYYCVDGEIISC